MENSMLTKMMNAGFDPAFLIIGLFAILLILVIVQFTMLSKSKKRITPTSGIQKTALPTFKRTPTPTHLCLF